MDDLFEHAFGYAFVPKDVACSSKTVVPLRIVFIGPFTKVSEVVLFEDFWSMRETVKD